MRTIPKLRRLLGGFTLLELSISLLVLSLLMGGALVMATDLITQKKVKTDQEKLAVIQQALQDYATRNGRLPCVASRTAKLGDSSYGREVLANCVTDTSEPAGTKRTAGIRIGALPTRDLLLQDDYMVDGFGSHFTYAVTEALTDAGSYASDGGVITLKDASATDISTNVAYVVFTHGKDAKGAYAGATGALKVACGASANLDVENCDDNDATFTRALYNAGSVANKYFDDSLVFMNKEAGEPLLYGFKLINVDGVGTSNGALATGDVNGDGYDDIIVGAPFASMNGYWSGGVYVVFGSADGIATPFDVSTLNGTNGFKLAGASGGDHAGWSVASGDINNDGYDDIIVGSKAPGDSCNTTQTSPGGSGCVYVIFGKGAWGVMTVLDTVAGGATNTGFTLEGYYTSGNDQCASVASCDVNGDGYGDLIAGCPGADSGTGLIAIIMGKEDDFSTSYTTGGFGGGSGGGDGSNGTYKFLGDSTDKGMGDRVACGDMNDDGYDDIIASATTKPTATEAGYMYVIYGKDPWPMSDSSATFPTTGFRLNGTEASSHTGTYLSMGNINGDNYDDLIIGARDYDSSTGTTYVVFGKSAAFSSPTSIDDVTDGDATRGFRLDGEAAAGRAYAASAGDVNNDGYDDLLIGAYGYNWTEGAAYLIYGRNGSWLNPENLVMTHSGTDGFRLDGTIGGLWVGDSTAMGDVNGDGKMDMLMYSQDESIGVYGIYGMDSKLGGSFNLEDLVTP